MKYILEIILTIIIVFFLWNILKRMFFAAIFKFPKPNQPQGDVRQQKTRKNLDSKINWDAETVDYEEIKEADDKNK